MKPFFDQGPGILECGEQKKGILPRVVDGIFEHIKPDKMAKYSIKLSMVLRHTYVPLSCTKDQHWL